MFQAEAWEHGLPRFTSGDRIRVVLRQGVVSFYRKVPRGDCRHLRILRSKNRKILEKAPVYEFTLPEDCGDVAMAVTLHDAEVSFT